MGISTFRNLDSSSSHWGQVKGASQGYPWPPRVYILWMAKNEFPSHRKGFWLQPEGEAVADSVGERERTGSPGIFVRELLEANPDASAKLVGFCIAEILSLRDLIGNKYSGGFSIRILIKILLVLVCMPLGIDRSSLIDCVLYQEFILNWHSLNRECELNKGKEKSTQRVPKTIRPRSPV